MGLLGPMLLSLMGLREPTELVLLSSQIDLLTLGLLRIQTDLQ